MIIKLTKADLQKGQAITPGWYEADIVKTEHKASKDGTSLNYVYTFRVPKVDDAEIDHYFNSKATGMMAPFIAAVMNKSVQDVATGMEGGVLEFDTEMPVGKKIKVEVINEPWEGRLTNKIKTFLPISAETPF